MNSCLLSCADISKFSHFMSLWITARWHNVPMSSFSNDELTSLLTLIFQSASFPASIPILALYYINKVKMLYPDIKGQPGSEKRVIIAALSLAVKTLSDYTLNTLYWSKISSMSCKEINVVEMEFLAALEYNLHVDKESFDRWTLYINNQYARLAYKSGYCEPALSAPVTYYPSPPAVLFPQSLYFAYL